MAISDLFGLVDKLHKEYIIRTNDAKFRQMVTSVLRNPVLEESQEDGYQYKVIFSKHPRVSTGKSPTPEMAAVVDGNPAMTLESLPQETLSYLDGYLATTQHMTLERIAKSIYGKRVVLKGPVMHEDGYYATYLGLK